MEELKIVSKDATTPTSLTKRKHPSKVTSSKSSSMKTQIKENRESATRYPEVALSYKAGRNKWDKYFGSPIKKP
jgi:hypothetical protein